MISQKMVDAFNNQINHEIFSSYLYASMETHFSQMGLFGFANWMKVQTKEELQHARKMIDYVIERGGKIKFEAVGMPDSEWENVISVFEKTLSHEQYITSELNNLINIAEQETDRASQIFLQWYIMEQVEEENNARTIIERLEFMGLSSDTIFNLDKELSKRKIEC